MPTIGELQTFKAEFFRALGHPVRIRLVEELGQGERTGCPRARKNSALNVCSSPIVGICE